MVCGSNPTVTELIDYEVFCGISNSENSNQSNKNDDKITEIDVHELKARIDRGDNFQLLDVRDEWETQINSIPGAEVIPLAEIIDRFGELDFHRNYVVHCKMGGRSAKAVSLMKDAGFKSVVNLEGGINAWVEEIDPDQQSY